MSYAMNTSYLKALGQGMKVIGVDPYTLTLDQEDIGGKPANAGEDRELLLDYMNQSKRFEAMGNDVFRDKYSSGIIHVLPNDKVSIYSHDYRQSYTLTIPQYRDVIKRMGTPEWDR